VHGRGIVRGAWTSPSVLASLEHLPRQGGGGGAIRRSSSCRRR
jgi:hypothetical protein